MNNYFKIIISTLFFLLFMESFAQISTYELPISFYNDGRIKKSLPTVALNKPNVDSLKQKDSLDNIMKGTKKYTFGYAIQTKIRPDKSGMWETLPNGDRLWRIQIIADGALFINLIFDYYKLPQGAKLFVYNKQITLGAYTDANNKEHEKFAVGPIAGDNFILEYYEPVGTKKSNIFSIQKVIYAYKDIVGTEGAASCHNNVSCYDSEPYKHSSRSVARIFMGTGVCSGALINQIVDKDEIQPYFLTAHHCIEDDVDFSTIIFRFNYSSPNCSNSSAPTDYSVIGSTLKATSSQSDFALLLLEDKPPAYYNVYYAGWTKQGTSSVPSSTFGIHHPKGDIKKISFDNNSPVSDSRFGIPLFPSAFWRVDDWESGTTEGGSSGSPLFDSQGRIIGQLLGGNAACDNDKSDWYGKIAWSWNEGNNPSERLREWLDPRGTGVSIVDGAYPCETNVYLQNVYLSAINTYQPSNEQIIQASNDIYLAGGGTYASLASNADVNFVAGNSVEFQSGFSAPVGVQMGAYIGLSNCTNRRALVAESSLLNNNVLEVKGEEQHSNKRGVQLFPNPTQGKFNLILSSSTSENETDEIQIKIYNILGEVVYSKQNISSDLNELEIDITSEKSGVYMIQVNRGSEIKVVKFIKE